MLIIFMIFILFMAICLDRLDSKDRDIESNGVNITIGFVSVLMSAYLLSIIFTGGIL